MSIKKSCFSTFLLLRKLILDIKNCQNPQCSRRSFHTQTFSPGGYPPSGRGYPYHILLNFTRDFTFKVFQGKNKLLMSRKRSQNAPDCRKYHIGQFLKFLGEGIHSVHTLPFSRCISLPLHSNESENTSDTLPRSTSAGPYFTLCAGL